MSEIEKVEIRAGHHSKEGTSVTLFAVYPPAITDDAIMASGVWEWAGWRSEHPGGLFAYPARIRRTPSRTLVTQFQGFDV